MAGLLSGVLSAVSAGVGGAAGGYEDMVKKDKEAERTRLRDDALAAKQEALVTLGNTYAVARETTQYERGVETAATAVETGRESTRIATEQQHINALETAANLAATTKENTRLQAQLQQETLRVGAKLSASATGKAAADKVAQIKAQNLPPAEEQRAIVAVISGMDLLNPKNEFNAQYSSIYRANATLVDNDPANANKGAKEKAAITDTMTKSQLGMAMAGGGAQGEDELGIAIGTPKKAPIPRAPAVPATPVVPTVPTAPGLLSRATGTADKWLRETGTSEFSGQKTSDIIAGAPKKVHEWMKK